MGSKFGLRGLVLVFWIVFVQLSLAQATLLEPNWADPGLQKYLADQSYGNSAPSVLRSATEASFTLPVLGLNLSDAAPPIAGKTLQQLLPECASNEPVIPPAVRDDTGTWYTLNYDWGCVTVSINGDRNSEQATEDRAPLPDGVSGIEVTDEGEAAGTISEVALFLNRFGLPYYVSIECIGDVRDFCQDKTRVVDLVSLLVPVDGQP